VLVAPDPTSHLRFPGFPLKPYLSVFIPGWTGHPVYNGHWSETADFVRKWNRANDFFRQGTDDTFRESLLRDHDIRYILYPNALAEGIPPYPNGAPVPDPAAPYLPENWRGSSAPSYLKVLYENAEITVYEFVPNER
ncbi:MAG: hypothetical protein SFU56_15225, partial [Capsulimonadales bacterium]|nr:hypothetical protein [Capsulimonadales bacterium]